MSDSVAQDMIQAFFERWQRLEEEKVAISGDLKELFAEAKANGFDTKVLRVVFRDKVADQNAKSEFEAVYDLYWSALGTPYATGARPTRDTSPRASRNGVEGVPEGQGETGAGTEGAIPSTGSKIHPSEAAMLPQTAGSETAVANSTPGSGAGTVDAGGANWPSEMTTASPANEPETIPPVADPATVVSEAANGDSAPSLAAIPVADRSQPNPICRDPDDCGVYASWAMPCQVCKAAAAHRSAA